MRKIKKFISLLLTVVTVTLLTPMYSMQTKAFDYEGWADAYSGTSSSGGSYTKGGVSQSKTGWLFYLVNLDGKVVCTPRYFWFDGVERTTDSNNEVRISTRIGNKKGNYKTDTLFSTCPKPYYTKDNEFYGNAEGLKEWLRGIISAVPREEILVKRYLECTDLWEDYKNNKYYLVAEPIFYTNIYMKAVETDHSGKPYSSGKYDKNPFAELFEPYYTTKVFYGTVYTASKYMQEIDDASHFISLNDFVDHVHPKEWVATGIYRNRLQGGFCVYKETLSPFGGYWRNRYCISIYTKKNYSFLTSPNKTNLSKSERLSTTNVIKYGYGIGVFQHSDIDDLSPRDEEEIEQEEEDEMESYIPHSVYETENHSDEYEISEGIPTTEEVKNSYNASCFYGEDNFTQKSTQNKSYGQKGVVMI